MSEPKEPLKVFAVVTVARQINGEFIFIRTDRAFKESAKADIYLKSLKEAYTIDGKPKPMNISTPNGDAMCFCETGVFEIVVED